MMKPICTTLALLLCTCSVATAQMPTVTAAPSEAEIRQVLVDRVDTYKKSVGIIAAVVTPQGEPALKPAAHVKTAKELESAITQLDAIFSSESAKRKFAGLTIGVVSGQDFVWNKSYGLADIDNKVPATKDNTYRIGSITKQFTAIMLQQLVQQGKVHLSDPVEKYYPEFKEIPNPYPYAPAVTLEQLAIHTAGLAMEPEDTEKYTTGPVSDWEKTLHSALPHLKYQYEPGTHYHYSNIAYAILGAALARAAGEPYTQYVQEHILKPLGMTHTAFEQNEEILRTLAKGYMIDGDTASATVPNAELRRGRGYKVPNGALFSTVGDMAKFLAFEMGNGPETVLPKSVVLDNFSRLFTANGDLSFGYGIGFAVYREGNILAVGHSGAVSGYHAEVYFDLSSQVGIVCLSNALSPKPDLISRDKMITAIKILMQ